MERLRKVDFLHSCTLLDTITKAPTDTQDILLELIHSYCTQNATILPLLDLCISKEINNTSKYLNSGITESSAHVETIFREDSHGVRTIKRFLLTDDNRNYLLQHLPPLFDSLIKLEDESQVSRQKSHKIKI